MVYKHYKEWNCHFPENGRILIWEKLRHTKTDTSLIIYEFSSLLVDCGFVSVLISQLDLPFRIYAASVALQSLEQKGTSGGEHTM